MQLPTCENTLEVAALWKLYSNRDKKMSLPNWDRIFYVFLIMVGFILVASASRDLFTMEGEYSAAQKEYEQLRELYPVVSIYQSAMDNSTLSVKHESQITGFALYSASAIPDSELQIPDLPADLEIGALNASNPAVVDAQTLDPTAGLIRLNPDYIGWISIEGVIDYPVVRGRDNDRYLSVTFAGQRNASGAVFMDYRNAVGFSDNVCILYGHNMRDGSMFAPLKHYLTPAFLEANPYITIMTSDGSLLIYRILAARQTDAWDNVYSLDFTAASDASSGLERTPDDTDRFLLLSTCTNSADRDDRLLVYAVLVT